MVLETTQHHPFWSETQQRWFDAADLQPGEQVGAIAGQATVVKVRNFAGNETMRDLTVANIHTYYVVAGKTPVLVHNCGTGGPSHNPAATFNVPEKPGVYTIHLSSGEKYVGMSTTNINSRA